MGLAPAPLQQNICIANGWMDVHIADSHASPAHWEEVDPVSSIKHRETHGQEELGLRPPYDHWPTSLNT